MPVGRTTRAFFSAAVANIVCWYNLGSKFLIISTLECILCFKSFIEANV
jgi:hypothetical protein